MAFSIVGYSINTPGVSVVTTPPISVNSRCEVLHTSKCRNQVGSLVGNDKVTAVLHPCLQLLNIAIERCGIIILITTNAVNHHPQHSVAVKIVERCDDIALVVVFEPVKCSRFRRTLV